MWVCLECGRKFKTIAAAERASDKGCPNCGSVDVDLDVGRPIETPPDTGLPGSDGWYRSYLESLRNMGQ